MNPTAVELQGSPDLLRARMAAREMVRDAGLGVMDQTRFATAVSELCRNVLSYAGTGRCELHDLSDPTCTVLQAVVRDQGPGIADLALALQDGYSTSGSLGAGLPGTRRIVDRFDIDTSPAGTTVTIEMRRRRRSF